MIKLIFSCNHIAKAYARVEAEAVARPSPGRDGYWYAVADGYGCSKDATTPERALTGMLLDHAVTNIRIRRDSK